MTGEAEQLCKAHAHTCPTHQRQRSRLQHTTTLVQDRLALAPGGREGRNRHELLGKVRNAGFRQRYISREAQLFEFNLIQQSKRVKGPLASGSVRSVLKKSPGEHARLSSREQTLLMAIPHRNIRQGREGSCQIREKGFEFLIGRCFNRSMGELLLGHRKGEVLRDFQLWRRRTTNLSTRCLFMGEHQALRAN